MISDYIDSNIDDDGGAHIRYPEIRFKIMSYNGEQIRIHLWGRGKLSVFNFISDNYQDEEIKESTDSEFIHVKSITDGLTEAKILSKFFIYLELTPQSYQRYNTRLKIAQLVQFALRRVRVIPN